MKGKRSAFIYFWY